METHKTEINEQLELRRSLVANFVLQIGQEYTRTQADNLTSDIDNPVILVIEPNEFWQIHKDETKIDETTVGQNYWVSRLMCNQNGSYYLKSRVIIPDISTAVLYEGRFEPSYLKSTKKDATFIEHLNPQILERFNNDFESATLCSPDESYKLLRKHAEILKHKPALKEGWVDKILTTMY